jgi:hypothetical protein
MTTVDDLEEGDLGVAGQVDVLRVVLNVRIEYFCERPRPRVKSTRAQGGSAGLADFLSKSVVASMLTK